MRQLARQRDRTLRQTHIAQISLAKFVVRPVANIICFRHRVPPQRATGAKVNIAIRRLQARHSNVISMRL
jgi:uncharacterized OB-fold protein